MSALLRTAFATGIRAVAELAITAGLVLLAFAFYLLVWTNQQTQAAQRDLMDDFRERAEGGAQKASKESTPRAGEGFGVLHIPALGKDWEWVVVEGVSDSDLTRGPGHFPGTALPGQVGNFAIAGHRATHGEPFANLDQVGEGDRIIVETVGKWLVYEVTWSRIVSPSAVEVVEPVAGFPGAKPTARTMTLVTCHPRWGSSERLVLGAELVERYAAEAGPPPDLA
ncbi:class E sortase [Nocardioides ochotonae]|uniref:class E sortase n=1 Tax=Nocardioides ochotonae TaxID=2685869 RepID=UPI00140A9CB0|nr:class E sortase [Nocardioides ochotonae]